MIQGISEFIGIDKLICGGDILWQRGAVVAPVLNSYASFDGVNDVVLPGRVQLTNKLTVECWINPQSYTDRGTIYTQYLSNFLQIHVNGKLQGYLFGTNNPGYHESEGVIPLNTWSHIAKVYDGATLSFLINGNVSGVFPTTGNIDNASDPVYIGTEYGGARKYHGFLKELRVWDVARTAQQIQENKSLVLSPQDGLKAYYRFNGNAVDSSGNELHGVVNNGVAFITE